MKVIYAGSFDPVTYGHLDIIRRAKAIFGEVIVAVLDNKKKPGFFTVEERLALLRETLKEDEDVEVDHFEGLLVDYAKKEMSPRWFAVCAQFGFRKRVHRCHGQQKLRN